jgi:hypothetical protein
VLVTCARRTPGANVGRRVTSRRGGVLSLTTVVDADRIVVLDGGRVVAAGNRAELLQSSPRYRAPVTRRLLVAGGSQGIPGVVDTIPRKMK